MAEHIQVIAEIAPGKPDHDAFGMFTNGDRAAGYARSLAESGDYRHGGVWIIDNHARRWRISTHDSPRASEAITPRYGVSISHDGRVEIIADGKPVARVIPDVAIRFGERLTAAGRSAIAGDFATPGAFGGGPAD